MSIATENTREQWLAERMTEYQTIERYAGYRFGSDGTVWSAWQRYSQGKMRIGDRWKQMHPTVSSRGYPFVALRSTDGTLHRNLLVHRLILEAFVGPCPPGCEARHFPDATRTNCAITNLIWGTRSENNADKWVHGSMPHGESHHNAVLTDEQVQQVRELYAQGHRQIPLAMRFGVSQSSISTIVRRETRA